MSPRALSFTQTYFWETWNSQKDAQKNVCAKTNIKFVFVISENVCKLNTFQSQNGSLQHIFFKIYLKISNLGNDWTYVKGTLPKLLVYTSKSFILLVIQSLVVVIHICKICNTRIHTIFANSKGWVLLGNRIKMANNTPTFSSLEKV